MCYEFEFENVLIVFRFYFQKNKLEFYLGNIYLYKGVEVLFLMTKRRVPRP